MIKIENAIKKYKDQVVLNDLNLELDEFGLVAIRGESGSGKTTLLNCLSGLDSFTSGTVTGIKKGDVSFIFQDFQLIDNLTIKENLLIVTDNKSNEIEEALEKVDIRFPDKKINQLSGGQKQRVAIARALLLNTKYIFADEPTGNLDSNTAENIVKLLKEISKEHLVFVVTHNVELFSKYCDRLITLKDGKIIDDIKNNDLEIDDTSLVTKSKRNTNLNFKKLLMINRANKTKNIALKIFNTVLTFVLIVIIFLSGNIFFNKKADALCLSMKEYNQSFIKFYQKMTNYEMPLILTDERIKKVTSSIENYAISYDTNFIVYHGIEKDFVIDNEYVTEYINTDLECGKNKLNDGEVVLSYYAAELFARYNNIDIGNNPNSEKDFSKLIDKTITINKENFIIVGVDKKIKECPEQYFDDEYKRREYISYCTYIYLNENTFNQILFDPKTINSVSMHTHSDNSQFLNLYSINDNDKLISGRNPNNQNEIVLSLSDVSPIFGNYNEFTDIINQEFEVGFKSIGVSDSTKYEWYKKTKLKVVGISDYKSHSYTTKENIIYLYNYSRNYCEIESRRSLAFFDKDLSKGKIHSLLNDNFVDNTFISESIENSINILSSIGVLLILISIPLLILLVVFQILYVKQLLLSSKRIIGILKSQLLKNKYIVRVFILDILSINVTSIIAVLILSPFVVMLVNSILIIKNFALSSIVMYNPLIIPMLLLFVCITTLTNFFISYIRLNKKSDVDLVYER